MGFFNTNVDDDIPIGIVGKIDGECNVVNSLFLLSFEVCCNRSI